MKENLLKETQQAHNKPFSCNIVLIGFMGAGKSTVSEYLSRKYNMDTVEMDQIIAEREKMSISDIFSVHGEEYFRDLETNLLIEMQAKTNTVISLQKRPVMAIFYPLQNRFRCSGKKNHASVFLHFLYVSLSHRIPGK